MSTDSLDSSSLPDALGPILESFLARLRHGERPSIKDYAERHPELAERILEVFPPLAEMELAGMAANASLHSAARAGEPPGATEDQGIESRPADAVRASGFERLGDYRIVREIGGGGMGIVYEAEREALHSKVALKVMHPKLRNRSDYLRWFLREARAAAGLHHTNIVTVFDYGQHDGVCYYAMQYIAGHSLDEVLEDVKRLKREAERASRIDGNGDLSHTRERPLEATEPNVPASASDLRSVTVGLVTGVFRSRPRASTESLAAALAGAVDSTHAMPPAGTDATPGAAPGFSLADPAGGAPPTSAPSGLSFAPSSSWSGKSSLRYQREIARIGAQVADALDYAHKRKVIHRDIKPHNILLDALGNAWITDFGLAKLKEEGNQSSSQAFAGTLRYMAPERLQGKSDGRDDVYAVGATLYEFLALRPVFEASDPHQLLSKIEHDPPASLRHVDRQIHPDLAAIIARALAKDPADRYATAAELRDELRRFIEGRPVKTRPVPAYAQFWRWCKRNPWLAAANIAAAAVTTILAIGMSLAARYYRDYSQRLATAVEEKGRSELDARSQLFEAHLDRARAGRFSHRVGQRFDSLDALEQAAKVGRGLGYPPRRFDRLRHDAIACMALPDMKPAGPPIRLPEECVAFRFDEGMTRYAIRLRDGTVLVRRMGDDHEIARFAAHGDRDIALYFSPDGRYLATTHQPGGRLTVWDVDRRTVSMDEPDPAWPGPFSPDSRRILMVGQLKLLEFDLATGRLIRTWPDRVDRAAFRPDGAEIAATDTESRTCRILETESGRLVRKFALHTVAHEVAWSPDGTTLAILDNDSKISVWDAVTGQRKSILEGATSGGLWAVFHPSGTLLATNGWEGRLRLWEAVLGRQLLSLTGGGLYQFSRDGRTFVQRGNDVSPWQVDPALEYRTLAHASKTPLNYARPSIHPDGRLLSVGTDQGVVIWDLVSAMELGFLPIGNAWHSMFDVSGDLLTNGDAGFWLWPIRVDSASGEFRIGPPRGLPLPGTHCAVSEDRSGKIIAVAARNAAYVALGEKTIRIGPLDDCRGVSVSPDGQWLSTKNHPSGSGALWTLPDGVMVAGSPPLGGSFSPDGKWLMTEGPPCRLYEVGTWREVRQFEARFRNFSLYGRAALMLDSSNVLGLVELETGRSLARFESPDLNNDGMAAFSPDGSRLVVTTNDPPPCVHVWDLRAIRRRLAGMGLDWDAPASQTTIQPVPICRLCPFSKSNTVFWLGGSKTKFTLRR
jgi:serine/threonine protein kinase/WD40 repeat protein